MNVWGIAVPVIGLLIVVSQYNPCAKREEDERSSIKIKIPVRVAVQDIVNSP